MAVRRCKITLRMSTGGISDGIQADPRQLASAPLRERIETRHGLRQLSAMREIGLGSENYEIVDLDKA